MKVLHINSYYSKGKFYKNLYDLQVSNGIDITVYIPVEESFSSMFDFGNYSLVSNAFSKTERFIFHLKHNKIVKDVVKKFGNSNFDLIHAHSLFSNGYVAMKIKEKYSIPYMVAVRNTDVNIFFKRMLHLRKLGINIIRNAERIVFLSPSYRDYVIKSYIPEKFKKEIYSKSVVIPNGIDYFWIKNKENPRLLKNSKSIKLIFVGSIDTNKNVISVIEASELLIREGIEVSLSVIGKVEDENIAKVINSKEFVTYYNYMPKEELIRYYRQCDIFVMPSKFETFGLVYAEAMSQGLPLIYTKDQGFDGHFKNGTVGYAVDANDICDISSKIKMVINNYDELSLNSFKNADLFKWEYQEEKYNLLYNEMLRQNNDYK